MTQWCWGLPHASIQSKVDISKNLIKMVAVRVFLCVNRSLNAYRGGSDSKPD